MSAITDSLVKAGFEPSVAEIYTVLVESGELSVGAIVEKSKLSRAGAYDALNLLLAQGYLEYRKEGRNAFYKAVHPDKLYGLVEEKKRESALLEDEMKNAIKSLTGAFNLTQNKPGVRFFEGEEGIYTALDDIASNFTPNTEILSFVKVKPIEKERELDKAIGNFIKKRVASNVKTLVLAIDAPEARALKENDKDALRETRLVPAENLFLDFPGGEIFIYGNEICAMTMEKNTHTALTVSSPAIAQMLKTFFLSEWSLLSSQSKPRVPSSAPLHSAGAN